MQFIVLSMIFMETDIKEDETNKESVDCKRSKMRCGRFNVGLLY